MRYFLRTTDKDGKSHGGFQWPLEVGAIVTAPDWNSQPVCGYGLHGLLNGEQNAGLLDWSPDALWWVVGVPDDATVVDLGGKCKFESCTVVAFGDRKDVTDALRYLAPGAAVHGSSVSTGNYGTSTSGNYGTSTSGDYGTSTSGFRGTSTSGDYGTSTSGYKGTSTSGYKGTLVIQWHDGKRYRLAVAYVGEKGIKPNTPYKLDNEGNFVEVEQ